MGNRRCLAGLAIRAETRARRPRLVYAAALRGCQRGIGSVADRRYRLARAARGAEKGASEDDGGQSNRGQLIVICGVRKEFSADGKVK